MTYKEIFESALGRYTENFNETEVQNELDEVYKKALAFDKICEKMSDYYDSTETELGTEYDFDSEGFGEYVEEHIRLEFDLESEDE